MPVFEWNSSFEVGVQQFDSHHQHLVGLLNKVYDDFTSGAPSENVGIILDELIDYATYHFTAEESWMKETRFPQIEQHSWEHEMFSKRVIEIQKDFHKGNQRLTLEVLTFLKNWLTNHILKSDSEYSRFISYSNGVSIDLC